MTAPRCRWSYSLRTLFVVVTALGCWLGRELAIVHKRYQLWDDWADATKGTLWRKGYCTPQYYPYCELLKPEPAERSAWRRFLGDKRFDGGTVQRPLTEDERALLIGAFPTLTIEVIDRRQWFQMPGAFDSIEDEMALTSEDSPATQINRP